MTTHERILIIDFGSQVTQLIARRIRECGVYAEIVPCTAATLDALLEARPRGVILSGGPASVYAPDAPRLEFDVRTLAEHHAVPVLGICYGLQLLAYQAGGSVIPAERREYGRAELFIDRTDPLFEGVPSPTVVWMSHGDAISQLPEDYEPIAHTENAPYAAIRHQRLPIWGLQFHPEVHHTADGARMLENFARRIAGARGTWTPEHIIASTIEQIRQRVGSRGVLCALSGGVDSTVAAVLIHRAIGQQLHCIHVDTGLMRAGESRTIEQLFREHFDIPITVVHAGELFLERLRGVTDPEQKRKDYRPYVHRGVRARSRAIPRRCISGARDTLSRRHRITERCRSLSNDQDPPQRRRLARDDELAAGGALPRAVQRRGPRNRACARSTRVVLERHPFPGPGLAIRIIGEVTPERLELLRQADEIFITELRAAGLYTEIWQAFAVLVPIQTVGVMGDSRTYEHLCVLRAVTSTDGMTADWYPLPHQLLGRLANRITSQVRGINRVCYDITSKPPATIEWE